MKISFVSKLGLLFLLLAAILLPLRGANAAEDASPIYLYHLEPLKRLNLSESAARRRAWDETHLVAALQGLANRELPQLYLFFTEQWGVATDHFWLERLSEPLPDGTPGWLQNRPRQTAATLEELLEIFHDSFRGLVVYDERVPATSNLASTIAGVENLLPIRYDTDPESLYSRLVLDKSGPRLTECVSLLKEDKSALFTGTGKIPGTEIPSTGSAKADAYRWLLEHYLKSGRCAAAHAGYYSDAWWLTKPNSLQNALLTNHDYFIAKRGFFFDLSPWEDETPVDDPNQPLGTDFAVFCDLLRAASERNAGRAMLHVGGFTPWDTKYTDHPNSGGKHQAVPTEWRHAEILSCFNAYMDADALGLGGMANASFFMHFPLAEQYAQKRPTLEELKNRGWLNDANRPSDKTFVTLYVGDYDSAAWVYQAMPIFWPDEARGTIPIGWAFNPNLADRFAAGFDYLRRTASEQDSFIAGDSGAGYVNPMRLLEPRPFSDLPSGLELWGEHCKKYYTRWDSGITGFIIDGFAPDSNETIRRAYSEFSPEGIVLQRGSKSGMTGRTPWTTMKSDLSDPKSGAKKILADTKAAGPQFFIYRTILWSPTKIKELCETVSSDPEKGERIIFTDPYSFFLLQKAALDEKN